MSKPILQVTITEDFMKSLNKKKANSLQKLRDLFRQYNDRYDVCFTLDGVSIVAEQTDVTNIIINKDTDIDALIKQLDKRIPIPNQCNLIRSNIVVKFDDEENINVGTSAYVMDINSEIGVSIEGGIAKYNNKHNLGIVKINYGNPDNDYHTIEMFVTDESINKLAEGFEFLANVLRGKIKRSDIERCTDGLV